MRVEAGCVRGDLGFQKHGQDVVQAGPQQEMALLRDEMQTGGGKMVRKPSGLARGHDPVLFPLPEMDFLW